MGRAVGQHERDALSFRDVELRDGREILAFQRDRGAQRDPARPGDGTQTGAVFELRHPGNGGPIVEAQRQVHPHRHLAAPPLHQADDRRARVADRHEVDECDTAVLRLEDRLQHHRAIAVGAADARRRVGGTDPPTPVVGRPEQSREAGRAVEAWPAQPIDRPVATHESGRRAIADHCVVFDGQRQVDFHGRSTPRLGQIKIAQDLRDDILSLLKTRSYSTRCNRRIRT